MSGPQPITYSQIRDHIAARRADDTEHDTAFWNDVENALLGKIDPPAPSTPPPPLLTDDLSAARATTAQIDAVLNRKTLADRAKLLKISDTELDKAIATAREAEQRWVTEQDEKVLAQELPARLIRLPHQVLAHAQADAIFRKIQEEIAKSSSTLKVEAAKSFQDRAVEIGQKMTASDSDPIEGFFASQQATRELANQISSATE